MDIDYEEESRVNKRRKLSLPICYTTNQKPYMFNLTQIRTLNNQPLENDISSRTLREWVVDR